MAKADSALSEIGTLSSSILLPDRVIGLFGCLWRSGELGLKMSKPVLSRANVGQKVEVVVEEIYSGLTGAGDTPKERLTELRNIC